MINDIVNSGANTASTTAPKAPAVSQAPSAVAPDQQPPSGSQPTAPEPTELAAAVSRLNDYVQNIQRTLSFSVAEDTGRTVIKVYDSETDELIRQIPPEDTIKLAAAIEEQVANLLLQERA